MTTDTQTGFTWRRNKWLKREFNGILHICNKILSTRGKELENSLLIENVSAWKEELKERAIDLIFESIHADFMLKKKPQTRLIFILLYYI